MLIAFDGATMVDDLDQQQIGVDRMRNDYLYAVVETDKNGVLNTGVSHWIGVCNV